MRFFNTAGPVNCQDHYCIPPLERADTEEILALIDQKKYFVLHAPRQTGKTSYLLALADHLNHQGKYTCLYVNVEMAQAARENIREGMHIIVREMASNARFFLKDDFLQNICQEVIEEWGTIAFNGALIRWAEKNPVPLVILIDEIDSLVGDTLISVLRQLRTGYTKRPYQSPQSVILCGVRDVRDYRIHSDEGKTVITGGSAFNIKAESLRMGDFSHKEISSLFSQHTEETGQRFEQGVSELIWAYTEGQPWLVNALGDEVCFRMKQGRDRHQTITPEMIIQAKENLILRRDTHIDQLADKLSEDRVHRVIEPMLRGVDMETQLKPDEIQYVLDLGLIRRDKQGIRPANAIYKEIIPREIAFVPQLNFESRFDPLWYISKSDGTLNMNRLLVAFQEFFRQHSEHWLERFQYKEAGPQLIMQAFLQRIVNSGGRVEREYGFGRMRTDLFIQWRHNTGIQKIVIEIKIRRNQAPESIIREGLQQTWAYMDRCGTDHGHLIIFDRNEESSWKDKIFQREARYQGTQITVWGM